MSTVDMEFVVNKFVIQSMIGWLHLEFSDCKNQKITLNTNQLHVIMKMTLINMMESEFVKCFCDISGKKRFLGIHVKVGWFYIRITW